MNESVMSAWGSFGCTTEL